MRGAARGIASAAGLVACLHGPALAQSADSAAHSSCLDSLPASALTRVPVTAVLSIADSTSLRSRQLRNSIESLAQLIVSRAQRLLPRVAEGALPRGEPVAGWRDLGGSVTVVAYRDGRYGARLMPVKVQGSSRSSAGVALLKRSVDSLRANDDFFFWDAGIDGDSASFTLELRYPVVTRDRVVDPPKHPGMLLFSVEAPWQEQVKAPTRGPRYPEQMRRNGYQAELTVRFIVDSTGRVVPSSIADVWPVGLARLTGDKGEAYDTFLEATREWLSAAHYQPAVLGGCPVPQLVQQPFTFGLRR